MDDAALRLAVAQVVPMPEPDMDLLMRFAQRRELRKGEILLNEGEQCRCFYFVASGYLRTYYNKDGQAINTSFALPGTFTANIKSFRRKMPSETIIEAGEAATIWAISLRSLILEVSDSPQISRFIRRVAIDHLILSESHSDLLRLYDANQRYRYIEQYAPELIQQIPLLQLASYLGVSRETLSRIRAKHS